MIVALRLQDLPPCQSLTAPSHFSEKNHDCLVKKYASLVNINWDLHPHVLHHAFATHLLADGAETPPCHAPSISLRFASADAAGYPARRSRFMKIGVWVSRVRALTFLFSLAAAALLAAPTRAQDNYEIQVYPGMVLEPHHTMLEFHTNFAFQGIKNPTDGTRPTHHALHETFEITHGFNSWFETGFYIFTSARSGDGWDFVGSHIRPRVCMPAKWHWPVGVSISNEIGWQRRQFSADTWTWEIRPIIDKQIGRWYLSFNPTMDKSFHGENANKGFEFSPNFKLSYDVTKKVAVGVEYYGALGPIGSFDPLKDQQQQIFPTIDLNLAPQWEINFGLGVGMTSSTDHLIGKFILGYRFNF